jgi:hypothetical protein
MSIFCGLAAARQRNFERLGWDINRKGFADAPRLRVIPGGLAHGTLSMAIALLGLVIYNV